MTEENPTIELQELVQDLQKQLAATQEMLASVLIAVGGEVVVPKKQLDEQKLSGLGIAVEENPDNFTFRIESQDDYNERVSD